ncbi:MAG: glycoside hydrolase family 28 protein, partial [Pirellulales bacterium]
VVVPAGEWFVRGPIHLMSGVNLHLEEGATIRFSTDPNDFLPAVLTRFEGNELMNFSPLIYAYEQENIAITGSGTFDGQAGDEHWWPWKGRSGRGPNQSRDSETLRQMAEDNVPASERVFGAGHYLRPNFVQPYRCKNVLIEGVTFKNSPMWILHPVLCENVTIRGVTVISHGANSDGCDPESCRDVLIEDCTFDTGDDCIAIKSGRNADGRRIGVPSENIIIRGCTMKDGHGGVVLGSEMSGGIRNVFVEDCDMDSPNLDRAIRLKSNSLRGGYLENLFVRNVRVGQVKEAVVRINLRYEKGVGEHPPVVRNIQIENVTSSKSARPFYLVGLENAKIQNVLISNCTFKNAAKPSVFEHVDEIVLRNFRMLPREGLDDD